MSGRLACLAVLAGCTLHATLPPAPPRHTSLGLGLSTFRLGNGLRVVLVRAHDRPRVSPRVTRA